MTPELWDLYLRLQTDLAYPPGTLAFHRDEKSIADAVGFYRWLMKDMEWGRALLIGPGGVNETEAMSQANGGATFDILTASLAEGSVYSGHRVVVGDMHDMPIPTGAYDLVYASNVLEHAFAPYIALTEIRRVLSTGGAAYFILPSFDGVEGGTGPFHLHCLDGPVWKELLHKTGFEIIHAQVYPPDGSGQADASLLGPSVGALLERTKDSGADFKTRTGCVYYACFLCRAVEPPHPHSEIRRSLIAYKGGVA